MRVAAKTWIGGALGLALLASTVPLARAQTQPASNRVALVVGEGAYRVGPLPGAPNDAGLVAQVLAGAGFDVTGARDLDGDGLRRAFRDFLDKAGAAGPDGIAVVYFAGRAIQADGDNFVVPVDARLARPSDVPIEALRLADFTHALAALPIQARVVVLDGAYAGAGAGSDAPGLALAEAEQGELLAFNAAPGTVAPPASGPYGAYAQSLVATIKQGGVPVDEVFDRLRLAVNQATAGAVIPWDSDKLTRSFTFFDRAPGAPASASAQVPFAALEKRALRDFPPDQAYDVALARDTLPSYAEFLAAFPDNPLARRIRLIEAVRREALFWRAALQGNTPGAYWTYLARYPKGPHARDARRRLSRLSAMAAPPPRFVPLGFDVPPPPPDEIVFDRPLSFNAPDLPPPPPPPVFLLPPPVVVILDRPAPPSGRGFLPVPVPVAIPFVRAPAEPGRIAPPRGVTGDYPRPRPFMRGPNGDGLVVQTSPAAPPPGATPPPGGASPMPGRSTAPPSVEQPPPSAGRPAPMPRPAAPPVPPTALPVPPTAPVPPSPRIPDVPAGRAAAPPPAPAMPNAPAAPSPPVPPHTPTHGGKPKPVAPAGGGDVVPVPTNPPAAASPPAKALPVPPPGTGGAARPEPAHRPGGIVPAPAAPPTKEPPPAPAQPAPPMQPPAPKPQHPPAAPIGQPAIQRPPAPEHPLVPQPQASRPTVPERPVAPGRPPSREPAPPAPMAGPAGRELGGHDPGGHEPGGHHQACGHPGEPPCRP